MKTLSTLYKIDSKGKQREFNVEFNDTSFTTYTGLTGGKLTSRTTNPTPKGKKTLAEQVESEANSKWRKKYERELYSEDLSKPHPLGFIQPMHALDYTKVPHRADWNANIYMAQPKLNGVRCVVQMVNGEVQLTSRKGTRYHVTHIEGFFNSLYSYSIVPNSRIFDGELYLHGVELGDVTHAVSNNDPHLLFKLFDHVDENKTFSDRYLDITGYRSLLADTHIEVVKATIVRHEQDLIDIHRTYVQDGYEGAMLRDINATYTMGNRTPGMFKYKHFQDDEFDIVGYEEDKDGGAILHLITPGGIVFKSRPMGTDAHRKQMLIDGPTLIGKQATTKYSELLKTGVPEFNRVTAIRDYE